jgi:spore germination protein YaaH
MSRMFLGDADGFGIMYYQDVDSIVHWSNEAAYHWGVRGIALWSLGQEDLRLWDALPKQI